MNTFLSNVVWIAAVALEVLILVRGIRAKLVLHYPVFYTYIFTVFIGEGFRFVAFRWQPEIYRQTYWITEFTALLLGAALMFEVYRTALARFPGTARMARNGLFFVFACLFVQVMINLSEGGNLGWLTGAPVEFERNLRVVQACCLITLLVLFLLYSIPVERNLKGILWGYSLFIACGVFQLTLVALLWGSVQHLWSYAQQFSYLLVLAIWTRALWSEQPSFTTANDARPELDYEELQASTHHRFQQFFAAIGRTVRP